MTPWKIDSTDSEKQKDLQIILFILIANLRKVALMLMPFFPEKMSELLERIGTPYENDMTL